MHGGREGQRTENERQEAKKGRAVFVLRRIGGADNDDAHNNTHCFRTVVVVVVVVVVVAAVVVVVISQFFFDFRLFILTYSWNIYVLHILYCIQLFCQLDSHRYLSVWHTLNLVRDD